MRFECGCVLDDDFFALPEVEQWESINMNCSATWDMIGEGLTKGVFQLEKSLGRRWCRKIKPRTVEELADVISLIRPGCLEAEFRENPSSGKMLSITDTYMKIRSGEWSPEYIHPSLEPILNTTYGVPVYQEQIMEICSKFAGLSLVEADDARKAMGKKDTSKMEIVHDMFVKGAVAKGNDRGTAEIIFSWIDKFSGYGFNKSHAVGYAVVGYQTAFAKTHFPIEFFKSMLTFSSSKQDEFDEIKQLVHEARLFGIAVNLPDARIGNKEFEFTDDGHLRFGLAHIKNVGPSSIPTLKPLKKVKNEVELFECLFSDKTSIKKNVAEALIKSGALDYCIKNRVRTLGRFRMLGALTPREQKWVLGRPDICDSVSSVWLQLLIENKIPRPIEKRVARIIDAWDTIKKELGGNRLKLGLSYEKFHLGMAVSGSEADLYYNEKVDTSCRNFLRLRSNSRVCMGVLIEEVRTITDKRGNPMCFMKISDSSYMLDGVVVFSSVFGKCGWIIEPGKAVMIKGKKQDTSLLVDSIEHL
jgi:DNA polymerase III subunit alpha